MLKPLGTDSQFVYVGKRHESRQGNKSQQVKNRTVKEYKSTQKQHDDDHMVHKSPTASLIPP